MPVTDARRPRFPINSTITLQQPDYLVNLICQRGRNEVCLNARALTNGVMTMQDMLAFIDRNEPMLPPMERA